tara:strand:+ start:286 stop:762 length:477 start_codon:yes stop_codon:yes gene_type:complete
MVGRIKTQSHVYNHIKNSDDRCCSTGRSRGSMTTRLRDSNWRNEKYNRKDEKECYDVVLNNGDRITKTYIPYRSKWTQRKHARRKNAEEFLDGEQTEGAEFIKDNNIKVKITRQPKWESKGTVSVGWVSRGSHQGFKPANSRKSYEQVDEVSEKAVVG